METVTGSLLPGNTDYSDSIAIAQFDTSLGTLESASITAQATGQFTQFYENLSTKSLGSVTMSSGLDLILNLPSSGSFELTQTATGTYSSIPSYTGSTFRFDGSSPYFTGPSSGSQSYAITVEKQALLQSEADLAQFTGSGVANFMVNASGFGTATVNSGNFATAWSTLAGLNLSVTYEYIPLENMIAVPESARWTWFAGMFAVVGLFTCIRTQQPKSS